MSPKIRRVLASLFVSFCIGVFAFGAVVIGRWFYNEYTAPLPLYDFECRNVRDGSGVVFPGVIRAEQWRPGLAAWRVTFLDGGETVYYPMPGDYCATRTVSP